MSASSEFAAIGAEQFISLTTFRTTGLGVATAVWVAPDGDGLVVVTGADSGKVKRIRNDPRVEMRPCNRMGAVVEGSVSVSGTAEVVADDRRDALLKPLAKKYGAQFAIFEAAGKVASAVRRRGPAERVILRITPLPA
jgi:uncharacterized protein